MEILIVSKTNMDNHRCVGGLELGTRRSVRLLTANGWNQPENTHYEIGAVWDIDYIPRQNPTPPHVEDVFVQGAQFIRDQDRLRDFLLELIREPWYGAPNNLFDGLLQATNGGSGYINEDGGIPQRSTGFWIPDSDLNLTVYNGNAYYQYPRKFGVCKIKYVGCEEPLVAIERRTLLRISLARWWRPEDSDIEKRCYLQLSGWYLD